MRSLARADTADLHTHLFVPQIHANLYFGLDLRTSTAGNQAAQRRLSGFLFFFSVAAVVVKKIRDGWKTHHHGANSDLVKNRK